MVAVVVFAWGLCSGWPVVVVVVPLRTRLAPGVGAGLVVAGDRARQTGRHGRSLRTVTHR
jgi:hypothetical protein